jgi:hypothetical protein
MRPLRPPHSLHPVFPPLAVPASRPRDPRRGKPALGFETLEIRTLLSTPRGVPPAAGSADVHTANGTLPSGWMACVMASDRARFALTFGSRQLADEPASLPPLMPVWPPAPRSPRWRETGSVRPTPRPQLPPQLPQIEPAAMFWPPRSGSLAPRPDRVPTPRFEIVAPRTAAAAPGSGARQPGPRLDAGSNRIARVAVYSSASFHGLRGPHLRFRTSFHTGFKSRVALPHEGR